MENHEHHAYGRRQPLTQRVLNNPMPTSAEGAQKVPVTPGISCGTYDQSPIDQRPRPPASDYFTSSSQSSSSNLTHSASDTSSQESPNNVNDKDSVERLGNESKGSVISATFTLPQVIQLGKNDKWVISILIFL